MGQPDWLTVTLAVYAFLGTALGFTAAGNTPTSPGEVAQAAVEVDATPPPEGYQPRHVAQPGETPNAAGPHLHFEG